MTEAVYITLKRKILKRLIEDKEKELHCHIQFVVKVGLELARLYQADEHIIELACLLHDIGRDHEEGTEDHADAGARISSGILKDSGLTQEEITIIVDCVKYHNKHLQSPTLEQKIVITADSATKVSYHEAFMLLCKKQTYSEKKDWGKKYLEKGYANTLFPEYKEQINAKYNRIKEIYDSIPASIEV